MNDEVAEIAGRKGVTARERSAEPKADSREQM